MRCCLYTHDWKSIYFGVFAQGLPNVNLETEDEDVESDEVSSNGDTYREE